MKKIKSVWKNGQHMFVVGDRLKKINEIVDWINREEKKREEARRILNESS